MQISIPPPPQPHPHPFWLNIVVFPPCFVLGYLPPGGRRALPPVPSCSLAYFGIAVICVRISYFILFTVRGLCYTLLDKTPVGKYNLFCKG